MTKCRRVSQTETLRYQLVSPVCSFQSPFSSFRPFTDFPAFARYHDALFKLSKESADEIHATIFEPQFSGEPARRLRKGLRWWPGLGWLDGGKNMGHTLKTRAEHPGALVLSRQVLRLAGSETLPTDKLSKFNFACRILGASLGWALFIYGWRLVLESPAVSKLRIEFSVLEVAAMIVLIIGGALWWIRHNLSIARLGHRGKISRYISPKFERDYFGRALTLPSRAVLIQSAVINLRIEGNRKIYSPVNLPFEPIRMSFDLNLKEVA